jgi:hypothetical protein
MVGAALAESVAIAERLVFVSESRRLPWWPCRPQGAPRVPKS